MKGKALLGMLAIVPGMFLLQATGSPSVVVINFDRVVAEAPGGKDAITKLNAFSSEQRSAIEKKQKEMLDMQNRLVAQDRVLSETARTQLIRDLDAAQTSIQTMGEEAQQRIVKLEQELLGPVQQKTANAVRTYAAEHSLKIVLDASALQGGLVYVHDTADITTEIIRRIALNMDGTNAKGRLKDTAIGQIRLNRPWADFTIPRVNPEVSDSGDPLASAIQQTP